MIYRPAICRGNPYWCGTSPLAPLRKQRREQTRPLCCPVPLLQLQPFVVEDGIGPAPFHVWRLRVPGVVPGVSSEVELAPFGHFWVLARREIIDEGHVVKSRHPFKGNMNLERLERLFHDVGPERIPLVMITVTNNSGGGQPVSLDNIRAVRTLCDKHCKPLFFDACRFAENAYLIKKREPGQSNRPVPDIVREMFDLADGATISAKKDGLVNIGGLLLFRDAELALQARNLLILTEGFPTYGGLAGRDLEAMAQGFEEVLHEDYLQYRLRSVEYLGERLLAGGVPIVEPPGGHAIYIDAAQFCPRIPQINFPGQALVCALYRHGGIRTVEIGSLMFGGGGHVPDLELVRLAIPRRVYTQSHIDYLIEAVLEVFEQRDTLRALKIVEASPQLRHFTARLAEIDC